VSNAASHVADVLLTLNLKGRLLLVLVDRWSTAASFINYTSRTCFDLIRPSPGRNFYAICCITLFLPGSVF
jgi:hypothetical protein